MSGRNDGRTAERLFSRFQRQKPVGLTRFERPPRQQLQRMQHEPPLGIGCGELEPDVHPAGARGRYDETTLTSPGISASSNS